MNDWKTFNQGVKQAIEEPTRKDLLQMDSLHLTIFELNQEKLALTESLNKVNEELEKHYKKVESKVDSNSPPNWAWKWLFKKTSIKWKEHFIAIAGQEKANTIIASAKQKEYPKIGIQYIDPHPEDIPDQPSIKPKRLILQVPKSNPLFNKLQSAKGE